MKHFHFIPKNNAPISIPNDKPGDTFMRAFIPFDVDYASAYIQAFYNFKGENNEILILNFKAQCNRNYIGPNNIKFLCIQIEGAYNNEKIEMIVLKSKLRNNWFITDRKPGEYGLQDYPNWKGDVFRMDVSKDKPFIVDKADIVLPDLSLDLDVDGKDSCTIPPN
ncbi:hypothetical protein [Aquimarina sp. MMG016]|uniref:hypothetical protein n=1 Tax=Aquimarina sp. MMG016 TaxID=2822690 RepID=UPI001B3A1E20|nr:hypothetical protein [Aquimarina sp. MMG016]MBQ4820375.1 hypothetical protein [Aquimarina sp. MMG016]